MTPGIYVFFIISDWLGARYRNLTIPLPNGKRWLLKRRSPKGWSGGFEIGFPDIFFVFFIFSAFLRNKLKGVFDFSGEEIVRGLRDNLNYLKTWVFVTLVFCNFKTRFLLNELRTFVYVTTLRRVASEWSPPNGRLRTLGKTTTTATTTDLLLLLLPLFYWPSFGQ